MKILIIYKLKLAIYGFLFLNIIVLSLPEVLVAQAKDNFEVKWIGEFKTTKNWSANAGIIKRFLSLVLGDDFTELIRPVNIWVRNEKYWIPDQGSKSVNFIDFQNKDSERLFDVDEKHFPSLVGICSDEIGNIYVTDSQQNKITKINITNNERLIFAESINFNKPTGIAYSAKKERFYVCETGKHRILVLDKYGKINGKMGKRGKNENEFNFPTHIWADKNGSIYIVDSMNFRVQIFDTNGKSISIFGEAGDGTGYLARPKGIATDTFGHIFVVDALFHNIQVFNTKGELLYYFGKQGRGKGEFWLPSGIYIDELNKIFIADSFNSRIQIFQLENKNEIEN